MAIDLSRRRLLRGIAAAGLLPFAGCRGGAAGERPLLSSFRAADGRYGLCCLHENGRLVWVRYVAERVHDMAVDAVARQVVFLARRPGRTAWVLALDDGELLRTLRVGDERHFNGHAAISGDGRYLYATETRYAPAQGRIGIWDLRRGRRLGEFSSGGLDPHQILRLPDHRTLVVANGGLLTAAGDERAKLNVDSMRPNLSYLDAASGRLLRQEALAPHQLSIRHLSLLPHGRVAVGLQYEGDHADDVPLVAIAGAARGLNPVAPPAGGWQVFAQYIASVCASGDGRYLAATSPRGACYGIWRLADAQPETLGPATLGTFADVAGAAPTDHGFVFTSGIGSLASWAPGSAPRTYAPALAGMAWDNHAEPADSWLRV